MRIATSASTREILIREALRHLFTGKSYAYDRGETLLKGFEDAVRLYTKCGGNRSSASRLP